MKLWLVLDTCYDCKGETIAVFENEKDARSLCHAYPWLKWQAIETEEVLNVDYDYSANRRYEEWFNARADKALRERDCD